MKQRTRGYLAICLATSLMTGTVMAGGHQSGESNEVKYRVNVMNALGSQFGALAMVFTRRIDQPDNLQLHTEALATTAKLTASLFPEGSAGGKSLPVIWDEPEKFAAAVKDLEDSTAALAAAASSGDRAAVAKAFKDAGASCKGCHERYKEEDE
ncbi:MAG: c-type cytochrome [Gammaproteobacteria bacterium]